MTKVQCASTMLDIAVRMQQATVPMPRGEMRKTLLRSAQLMRLAAEHVVEGRWSLDLGLAYIDAGKLTLKGLS